MSRESRKFHVPDELANLYDFANTLDLRKFVHHGVRHEQAEELATPSALGAWMRERGLGVVLVSHNLADVFAVADRIAVLRLGRNTGSFQRGRRTGTPLAATYTDEVTAMLYGTKRLELEHRDSMSMMREEDA